MRRTLARTLALVAVVAAILVAAPASAVQQIQGFTWYSDGDFAKTGPAGTVVTVFATGAVPNAQFDLLIAPSNPAGNGCSETGTSAVNPNIRTSSAGGFIPNTSGPVNRTAGEYQICFYERAAGGTHRTGTNPVFFTVV